MTKYEIKNTTKFKKDYKLTNGEPLDAKYKDHQLSGNWIGHRECHIQPDWLLVYRYEDDVLVLTLTRTGTHSDLFNLFCYHDSHKKQYCYSCHNNNTC